MAKSKNIGDKKMGRKNKILDIIVAVLTVLANICLLVLSVTVSVLGVLPLKWMILSWGGAVIFAVLTIFAIYKKDKIKKWMKIIDCVVCGILAAITIVATVYLVVTANFLDKINGAKYRTEIFDVVVLESAGYEELENVKEKNVGVLVNAEEVYLTAIQRLEEVIPLEKIEFADYFEMAQGLEYQEVAAIFLPDAYYNIIVELDKDFDDVTKIIYTVEIRVEIETDVVKEIEITSEPFNIFISGIDTYGDISTAARSDVNMVVTVNQETNQILMTSIPRDYYVQLHDTTGTKDKLTHAGVFGVEKSVATVEDLLDVDIKYYIKVNFSSVINVVDMIGGVEIESDTAFTAKANKSCKFVVGKQSVDGKCALAFARERKAYATGDRHRVLNQQEVFGAILRKITSSTALLTNYSGMLDVLGGAIQTNVPTGKIYALVNYQLDKMPEWTIETYSLDGVGDMQPTYSMGARLLYVMQPDMETVESAHARIENVLQSE